MAVISRTDGKPWNAEVALDPDRVKDAEARIALMLQEAAQLRHEAMNLEQRAKQLAQTWGLDTHVP